MDKLFDFLKTDPTYYTVNISKLHELEDITALNKNVYAKKAAALKLKRECLNLQLLLITVLAMDKEQRPHGITIGEFTEYCEKMYTHTMKHIKNLILIALAGEYLIPSETDKG